MQIFSYLVLIVVSTIAMLVLDEDPTQVSVTEWCLFTIILFAGFLMVKEVKKRAMDDHE